MTRVYKGEYTDEDLNRFRERVLTDFTGREKPKTKSELRLNMHRLNYRGEKIPTQKQVDFAWDVLSKMKGMKATQDITQETRATHYKRESYKRGARHRATRTIKYRGKTYRKGMFLPYDYGRGLR